MGFILAIFNLVGAMFAYRIDKKIYNPMVVMLAIWGVILGFYGFRAYGINDINDSTYFICAIGLAFFSIGCLCVLCSRRTISMVHSGSKYSVYTNEAIRYRLVKVLALIVLLFLLEEAIETFVLIRSGVSLFSVRTSLQGYAEYDFSANLYWLRKKIGVLYTWFIMPMYNALILTAVIDFFVGKKDKALIGMALVCLVLKSFKEGSRLSLLYFAIYLFFSMIIYGKKIELSEKLTKKIRLLLIMAIIGMIAISNIRISQGQKGLFEEIYIYFTCCMPILDTWLENVTSYTHGAMSLYGVIQLPVVLLSRIFIGHTPEWYTAGAEAISETETFITIRNADYSTKANAFTTFFYYFYKDAGIFGVIIGSFLFGVICSMIYKRLKKRLAIGKIPVRLVYVYLLIIQAIVLSFVRIYSAVASFSFTFLYAFFLIKKDVESKE